jgi:NAD(P)-dependent dehydrogenase (short-subunit alcohol dehydrogenase family)
VHLSSKVVLITGGRRIGETVALAVAEHGADVALTFRSSFAETEQTAAKIRALGRRAVAIGADVSQPEVCATLVETVVRELGRLDVLMNMASVYRKIPLADVDAAEWDRQMAVELRATFLVSRAAVPHMRRNGGGRIINFADWVAASGRPRYRDYVPYYVAKAGVKALTEALALELAADQILVNAIAPGPILAPPGTTDEELRAIEAATPLGRWGGAEEIAKVVLALIDSDFITGETIRVDGGRHVR